MPRKHPFPCIGELASELARSAWEASLPDIDTPHQILTVTNGLISQESLSRLQEYMEGCQIGGSKVPMITIIEGEPASTSVHLKQVEGIKFEVNQTSLSPNPILDEYLESLP